MHEILATLPSNALVLDLGCGRGSFQREGVRVLRIDLERPSGLAPEGFVLADSARLPLPDRCLDALISNHSLEHFVELQESLREIGRIMRPDGAIFLSVPDASTFSDRLYRWMTHGGGHVNAFRQERSLVDLIVSRTGLKHLATRPLYTSLNFLNRRNWPPPRSLRMKMLGGGSETSLRLYTWVSRLSDRLLRTRLSSYGWALYFGTVGAPIDTDSWVNVCIRCGNGSPSAELLQRGKVYRRWWGQRFYHCLNCSARNLFSNDPQS